MTFYERDTMSAERKNLSGDFLYVAGSDLYNPLNQPSQHMPYHLATHLKKMDLVGYVPFYNGSPAPAWQRITQGMRNVLYDRINFNNEGGIRTLTARRLRLPGAMDPMIQDLWMSMILHPYLGRQYHVGIVDGPESAFFAQWLKKTGRIKFLIYYDIDYYPAVYPRWSGILSRREQLLCHVADAVASVSRPLAGLREQQGAKLAVVVPNGVDFTCFYKANLLRKEHPPTIIYMGSLDLRWGVDLPVRAMPLLLRRFPDIRLIIAGRGPAESELHKLAAELRVQDHICFEGFVPYPDLPSLLAQADIGVATSRQNEFRKYASPLKLVEYMAAGLAVICSGGGEAEEMVGESKAGVNIPFEPGAFAKAVEMLLTTSNSLSSYRKAAIQYAQGRSWEQMGTLMAQLISQVAINDSHKTVSTINIKGESCHREPRK